VCRDGRDRRYRRGWREVCHRLCVVCELILQQQQ
jgi:hypothetical protein